MLGELLTRLKNDLWTALTSSGPGATAARLRLLHNALAWYAVYVLYKKARKALTLDKLLTSIPGAQSAVEETLRGEVRQAVKDMFKPLVPKDAVQHVLPKKGRDHAKLLQEMKELQKHDATGDGTHFAYIYDTQDAEFKSFVSNVHQRFAAENGLNPVAFPALRKFEVDVVRMTAALFHGPPSTVVGTMTSGGTESILCALKAYRERARALWPHITRPEVVAPISVHVAFPKGGHLFDLTFRFVPLDPVTMRPDMAQYKAAINENTILLVGSAPQYPHGVVDPIEDIAALAAPARNKGRTLPVHVDACIGGFILPFIELLGRPVPKWDFRVPGVTSISADCHKYGYAPKGASTVTYRSDEYRKYQFWSFSQWPGGLFVSPSLLGTRPGGAIAGAWAAMVGLGEEGYLRLTSSILATKDAMLIGIRAIPGLAVLGAPEGSIISFTATDPASLNILAVADVMEKQHGWGIERQQNPPSIHMTLMPPHAKKHEQFLANLRSAVEHVRAHPELAKEGSAAMYGLVAKIPSNVIVEKFLLEFESQVFDVDRYDDDASPATTTSTSTTSTAKPSS